MKFKKMHGLGNDFVVLDQREGVGKLSADTIKYICDRRRGVGCDQLIIMEPSDKADFFMRIYNPDGSQAEACGNATRCVSHIYMTEKGAGRCSVETLRGVLSCFLDGELVRVDMGRPVEVSDLDLRFQGAETPISVNVGNPHVVFFVDDAESVNLSEIGPQIECHEIFPDRTNVEFVHANADGSLRMRVWERGAGITQACGSGACAVMVAAVRRGVAQGKTDIHMDGGVLSLEHDTGGSVFMTGPVAYVFDGTLENV